MSAKTTLQRSLHLGRLGLDLIRTRREPEGPARDAARRLVADRLGRLRGLPQKIGQILSLRELGTADSIFADLTESASPVRADEAFAWIERELGLPVGVAFRRLDPVGAAASLGQVHRGELPDGRVVAVKVQYPGIRETLDADLAAIGWLTAPLSANRSGFDLRSYRHELRAGLIDELDYGREADALRRAAARSVEIPGVVTPHPIEERCTARVLTMTWVEGKRVQDAARWPASSRTDAARLLLRFFLRGCFVWREMHADPHPGNLRLERTPGGVRLGVLDFGCVKTLSPAESGALARLCSDGGRMSDAELLESYLALGFNPALLTPIADRLRPVTAVLCEPFWADGPFDVRQWRVSERLAKVLGDDRWNFRFAGPASLLYFIRAFQGLVQYVDLLDVRIDWRAEFLPLVPGLPFDGSRPLPSSSPAAAVGGPVGGTPSRLRLKVVRGGDTIAQLTFPVNAVAHLEDLVPEEMHPRIRARGVDLASVASRTVAAGYPAGDLFALADGGVSVRVWIE